MNRISILRNYDNEQISIVFDNFIKNKDEETCELKVIKFEVSPYSDNNLEFLKQFIGVWEKVTNE